MPNAFSPRTLGKFEDASASIPLRQMARAFEAAHIRMGEDPREAGGSRRTQFRRYVAGVNQRDPQQLERLGDALGALIAEVADSKVDFLVKAAESDGFVFANRVFRSAAATAKSFAVTRLDDVASIDERATRLHLLANDRPKEAVVGAKELVESLCRTVLRLRGETLPNDATDLGELAKATLGTIGVLAARRDDSADGAAVVGRCLQQLGALVGGLAELENVDGAGSARDGARQGLATRHARLAVGAASLFAGFVADAYVEEATLRNVAGAVSDGRRKGTQ